MKVRESKAGWLVAMSLGSLPAVAAPAGPGLPGIGSARSGLPWTIVVLLTLLTLLPALLLAMTPLLRLLVIFHFLRQALGTQTVPTNQTLVGLALVLTYFLMQPVGAAIYQQAWFRWRQADHGLAGDRSWLGAAAPFHAEVRARKRCCAVRGAGQVAAARARRKICPCEWSRPHTCSRS